MGYFCIWVGVSNFQLFAVCSFFHSKHYLKLQFPILHVLRKILCYKFSLLNSYNGMCEYMIKGLENAFT